MHKIITAVLFVLLGFALIACAPSGSVSYQPPNLPIKISIDTNGHLEVSWENSIQTPMGTFSAEITSDLSSLYTDKDGVLIVNVDNVNSVYDLNGQDNVIITLESGYYQQVELRKDGNNWYFKAQRLSNELSVQHQSQPASSGSDNCIEIVSASRELTQNGMGETCWLKLSDGGSTDLVFNETVQVTYRTVTGGNDVYFYIAQHGDRLSDVIGATIRPMRFVDYQYGGLDSVKEFEIAYHSPGFNGGWATCLRDANNGFTPLNNLCN